MVVRLLEVWIVLRRPLTQAYDKVGNVTSSTDALGHTTSYGFNAAYEQTSVTDPLGHTTTTLYDAAGNQTSVTDALLDVTTYTLDAQNRVTGTTDPNGNTTQTLYDADGDQVGTVDALGHQSLTVLDMDGQTVGSVNALGDLTQTQVDADGETTAVIDPDGNVTRYYYNTLGEQTLTVNPLGYATTAAYDTDQRVTSVTDADGRQILTSYDNDSRETGEVWKNSSGTTVNTVTYTYDKDSNMLTAADGSGTITMSYDALSRETVVTDVFGNTLTYTYNANDQVTQRTDSGGGVQTYVYDNASRETSVQLSATSATVARADFGYNNRNDMTSVTRYSDLAGSTVIGTTVYGYDPGDRVTAITNKNSSAATISYYDYTYDNADRVSTQTAVSGSTTFTYNYSYDNSNQLLSDGTTTYSYDANGNKTMTGYTTGPGNQLTNDGTYTYDYDNAGNMTEKTKGSGLETWYYGYDNENRLTSVRETSNGTTNVYTATYTYDILNDRIETDTWSSSTMTLIQTRTSYDRGKAWADLSTSNAVQTRYLYDPAGNLVERFDIGTGLRQVFTDDQGSVRDVANTSGTVLDHIEYNAFGMIKSETGSTNGGNYLYTGLFQDRTSGVVSALNRAYLSQVGVWMETDPAGFGGGQSNLYDYVGNDPTNGTDPTGLKIYKEKAPNDLVFLDEVIKWAVFGVYKEKGSVAYLIRNPRIPRFFVPKEDIAAAILAFDNMKSWKSDPHVKLTVYYITDNAPRQFYVDAAKQPPGSANLYFGHGSGAVVEFDERDAMKGLEKLKPGEGPALGMGCCYAKQHNDEIPINSQIPGVPQNTGECSAPLVPTMWAPMINNTQKYITDFANKSDWDELGLWPCDVGYHPTHQIVVNLYFGEDKPRKGQEELFGETPKYRYRNW